MNNTIIEEILYNPPNNILHNITHSKFISTVDYILQYGILLHFPLLSNSHE